MNNTTKILIFVLLLLIGMQSVFAINTVAQFDNGEDTSTIHNGDSVLFGIGVIKDTDAEEVFATATIYRIVNQKTEAVKQIYQVSSQEQIMSYDYVIQPEDYQNTPGEYVIDILTENYVEQDRIAESKQLFLTVTGDNQPPKFTSEPNTHAKVNEQYVYQATAKDPENDKLTFSGKIMPSDMTIDAESGLILWIPENTGDEYVVITVTDGTNKPVQQSFLISVDAEDKVNSAPYFTSEPVIHAKVNSEYAYDVDAIDTDGDDLKYSLVDAPKTMAIDEESGLISWIPKEEGEFSVSVAVSDGINAPVIQSFLIFVEETIQNQPPKADFYWTTPVYLEELVTLTSNSTDEDGAITKENWVIESQNKVGNPITHRFSEVGSIPVTLTVTDNQGATDKITKYVEVKQRILEIDHFSCNEDFDGDGTSEVVAGEELMCVAHIKDNVQGVTIKFDFNGDGQFEECVTDFKGQCSSTLIVNKNQEAGIYETYAVATKPNWKTANAGPVLVEVWKQRYKIINLQIFEDEFNTEQDTFYRKTPMYVSFDVYDELTDKILIPGVDENVLDHVYLKVKGAGIDFDKWSKTMSVKSITPDYSDRLKMEYVSAAAGLGGAGTISGIDDTGLHKFVIDEIPITDDFLGDGKVFAFTFNFTDRTAGQATKNVNILNNELEFNPPSRIKLVPGESVLIDLTKYVSDIETPVDEIKFTYGNTGHLIVNPQNTGALFKIFAEEGRTESTTILFTADDTDGSVVTKGIEFYIADVPSVDTMPVAVLTMPNRATQDDLVALDGSKSYDTNEDGYLTNFAWKITLANKVVYETSGMDKKINFKFKKRALYDVTLTVTDNTGNKASTTNTIEIMQSKENMDDEDNEKGIWVDYFDIYGTSYGTINLDEPYFVTVKVRNERSVKAKNVKVSFSLPELGYKDTANNFNLGANGDSETVTFGGYLPFTADEVPSGEYVALITVKTGDILRTKYYPLYIETK